MRGRDGAVVRHAHPGLAPSAAVDLNADVGESFGRWVLGDDARLVPYLTSATVACGFHAGDPATIRRTCALAARHGVAVGAQVAYRDLAGFGRRFLDVAPDDLAADVAYQVGGVAALARAEGTRVTYVKPHGALYHAMSSHPAQAEAVVAAVLAVGPDLSVVGWPGSHLLAAAEEHGLRAVPEGFADRRYGEDGALVDRRLPGAVLEDPAEVADQALRLARSGRVETLCLHGDSPGAVTAARAVRARLEAEGVDVQAFSPPVTTLRARRSRGEGRERT